MKSLSKENRLHQSEIPIIGITGGIACGKTTFCNLLESHGQNIINADSLIKEIYQEKESYFFIKEHSPQSVENNRINFKKLRAWFFENSENQKKVEQFLYKKLPAAFLKKLKEFNNPPFVFYDIPLLFEKKLQDKFDLTVCLYIPKKEQIKRLIERDQINEGLANSILSKQIDIETKKGLSDVVIENTSDKDILAYKIKPFLEQIQSRF